MSKVVDSEGGNPTERSGLLIDTTSNSSKYQSHEERGEEDSMNGGGHTQQAWPGEGNSNNSKSSARYNAVGRPRIEIPKVDESEQELEEAENSNKLLIAFVLMLLFQLGNRIFGRLMTYPMHNYPTFTNLLSIFIYVPMCFVYIWPMMFFTGEKVITAEQKEIPKYVLILLYHCSSFISCL
jgi:hypothetical protein